MSLGDFPKGLSVDLDETDDLVDTDGDEIANEIFKTLFSSQKENPSYGKIVFLFVIFQIS